MNGDQRKLGWWDMFERAAKVSSVLLVPILLWGISVELRLGEVPSEYPPPWVREDLVELKSEVKDLSEGFSNMRVEMNGRLRAIETLLRDQ